MRDISNLKESDAFLEYIFFTRIGKPRNFHGILFSMMKVLCRDQKSGENQKDSQRMKAAKLALNEALSDTGYINGTIKEIKDSGNITTNDTLKQYLQNITDFIKSFVEQIKKTQKTNSLYKKFSKIKSRSNYSYEKFLEHLQAYRNRESARESDKQKGDFLANIKTGAEDTGASTTDQTSAEKGAIRQTAKEKAMDRNAKRIFAKIKYLRKKIKSTRDIDKMADLFIDIEKLAKQAEKLNVSEIQISKKRKIKIFNKNSEVSKDIKKLTNEYDSEFSKDINESSKELKNKKINPENKKIISISEIMNKQFLLGESAYSIISEGTTKKLEQLKKDYENVREKLFSKERADIKNIISQLTDLSSVSKNRSSIVSNLTKFLSIRWDSEGKDGELLKKLTKKLDDILLEEIKNAKLSKSIEELTNLIESDDCLLETLLNQNKNLKDELSNLNKIKSFLDKNLSYFDVRPIGEKIKHIEQFLENDFLYLKKLYTISNKINETMAMLPNKISELIGIISKASEDKKTDVIAEKNLLNILTAIYETTDSNVYSALNNAAGDNTYYLKNTEVLRDQWLNNTLKPNREKYK